jgi:ATP-dependent DNA ligase
MRLPVMPPVAPMLAKVGADLPPGAFYEPKWDGFRSIVFRDGDEVEIGSRNTRPMARYFPEMVEAARERLPPRVVDGEIVVPKDLHLAPAAPPPRRQPRRPAGGPDAGELRRFRPARPRR